jgi:predicted PurR-regulated permease PerM
MTFETKKNFIINVAFVVVVYAVLYFIFKYVIHWLTPFIIGFLITYALRPVTRLVTRLTRIKGKGIAIFVVAAFYAIVALVIWLLFT